jgi:UDP-2-acetamido-3-amino-2,3-dideoxy-glucuronate N-acetyltransferase
MSWSDRLVERPRSAEELLELGSTTLLHTLWGFRDQRGSLVVAQASEIIGQVERVFFVYGSTVDSIRGDHAHRECAQLVMAPAGWTDIYIESPNGNYFTVRLSDPKFAVLIPPMHWACQYRRSNEAVLAVAASHKYCENDYIRDYQEWKNSLHLET